MVRYPDQNIQDMVPFVTQYYSGRISSRKVGDSSKGRHHKVVIKRMAQTGKRQTSPFLQSHAHS